MKKGLEQRKLDEIEFHNSIRLVTDDPDVADTRWNPTLEKTVSENPLWANIKYYRCRAAQPAVHP